MIPFAIVYRFGDDIEAQNHQAIYVEYRSQGNWIIARLGEILNKNLEWEYEPRPSDMTSEFVERTRWTLEEALGVAEKIYDSERGE